MDSQSFYFDLPKELIAQHPSPKRGASRLMVVNPQRSMIEHKPSVQSFLDYVDTNAVVVFNNSRVRKARVFGLSSSGGRVEFFFLNSQPGGLWEVLVSKARKQIVGCQYRLDGDVMIQIVGEAEGGRKVIRSEFPLDEAFFEDYGHVPLPPYIKREDEAEDEERYQNVFAREIGSVAAPTAGLHFSEEIMGALKGKAASVVEVTLHVGLGTFEPIRTQRVENHRMHTEHYFIEPEVAQVINGAKREGKRILAVGTTSLRVLESAINEAGQIKAGEGSTNIFIYPGYCFKVVDALFTNFHTPDSTLFLLICAFAGQGLATRAYQEAIEREYRFFSYGDATFFENHL